MKLKLFLFLIILILIGGAAFYFGWVQFQLDEHTYGVMFSKTSGYEDEVIRPGEFNWRWEALIPTNMTLHKIELVPHSVEIQKSGTLPSGEVYASAIEAATDFQYALGVSLTYSLLPDSLPELVEKKAVSSETLDNYFLEAEQRISTIITSFIENRISTNELVSIEDFKTSVFETELKEKIQSEMEVMEISSVVLTQLRIPDIELYQVARSYYFDLLETKQETETETLEKQREWVVSQESKLEVLEQYGELFTKYSGLIQYFALGQQDKLKDLLPKIDLIQSVTETQQNSSTNEGATQGAE